MILLSLSAFAAPLDDAVRAELARAKDMLLADAPAPYFVAYDVIEGGVTECFTENGSRIRENSSLHRELRAEVRIGDYHEDSSNVSVLGARDPVDARLLPIEDLAVSLRREIWLATDHTYKAAIEALSQKRSFRSGQPARTFDDFARITAQKLAYVAPGKPTGLAAFCGLMERLSAVIGEKAEVGQAVGRDWQGVRYTATNEGTDAWRPAAYTVVRVEGATTLSDGTPVKDARSWIVRDATKLPPEAELMAAARQVADWLGGQEAAKTEKEYLGPVLFEGDAATELFSQLLASEITGTPDEDTDPSEDSFMGGGPTAARLGRRLLPDGWSVVDDVSLAPNAAAAYVMDHEGVTPKRVELVKDGVVRDLLMSRIPSKDRAASTGHGRGIGTARRVAVPAVVQVKAPKLWSMKKLRSQALRLAADTGRDYVIVVRHLTPPAMFDNISILVSGQGPGAGLGSPYEVVRLYADGHEEALRPMEFVGIDRRVLRDVVGAAAGAGQVQTLDGPPGPARYQVGATGGLAQVWDVPSVLVAEVELVARSGGEPRVLGVR